MRLLIVWKRIDVSHPERKHGPMRDTTDFVSFLMRQIAVWSLNRSVAEYVEPRCTDVAEEAILSNPRVVVH